MGRLTGDDTHLTQIPGDGSRPGPCERVEVLVSTPATGRPEDRNQCARAGYLVAASYRLIDHQSVETAVVQ
jgi:hypothetical protein